MTKSHWLPPWRIAAMSTIPAFAGPKHNTQVACTEDLGQMAAPVEVGWLREPRPTTTAPC